MRDIVVHILKQALLAIALVNLGSCSREPNAGPPVRATSPAQSPMNTGEGCDSAVARALSASTLGSDLAADGREPVYRAYSYLRWKKVARMPDHSDETPEQLANLGKELTRWLQQQDLRVVMALIEEYPAYITTWSPYFPD